MTVSINIKTNAIEAKHFFDMLERQQLPFAVSKAINGLAYNVRDKEQAKISDYFEMRTPWLLKKGAMPVVPSRKSQYPDTHAILGVRDNVAALAATGGEKKAKAGQMAVPFSNTGGGHSTRQELNPAKLTLGPAQWPSRLVKGGGGKKKRRRNGTGKVLLNAEPKPFIAKGKATGRTFVLKRRSKDDRDVEVLYELLPMVMVGKMWPLVENVETFVGLHYSTYLSRALDEAIKNPKVKW